MPPVSSEGTKEKPPGERLARVETEIEGIGRTLTRLDKTQERQTNALEQVARGFAKMEAFEDRINRNSADVVAIDREVGEVRDIITTLSEKVKKELHAQEMDMHSLKAGVEAKWWVLTAVAGIAGAVFGVLMQLIMKWLF